MRQQSPSQRRRVRISVERAGIGHLREVTACLDRQPEHNILIEGRVLAQRVLRHPLRVVRNVV
jgi:hypothetical protein